jgi:hypothetical protein
MRSNEPIGMMKAPIFMGTTATTAMLTVMRTAMRLLALTAL